MGVFVLQYTSSNHIKSSQVLLALGYPFSTRVRGTDTMSDHTLTQEQLQEIPYGYCHCGCGQKTSISKFTNHRRGDVKGQPVRFVRGHSGVQARASLDGIVLPLGTRGIALTNGFIAIVDEADYGELSKYRWTAVHRKQTWYAARKERVNGKSVCHYMHRDIANVAEGIKVDHKDGNGLNNTRDNLRLATNQQNSFNQRSRGGTSQYKGVYYCSDTGRWRTRIKKSGKVVNIGRFDSEAEAARAYDKVARELYGEFAWVNFP